MASGKEWRSLHLWQIQPLRDALALAAIVGIVWLGYRLSLVTVPLLLALALAYLFEPVVRWSERRLKLSRPVAAIAIILLAGALVVVPVILGSAAGGVQAFQAVQRFAQRVDGVYQSTKAPESEALRDVLYEPTERLKHPDQREKNAWVLVRDWIVEQQRRVAARHERAGMIEPDAAESPDGARPASPRPPPDAASPNPSPNPSTSTNPDGPPAKDPASVDPTERPASEGGGPEAPVARGDASAPDATGPDAIVPEDDQVAAAIDDPMLATIDEPSDLYLALLWGGQWIVENAPTLARRAAEATGGAFSAAASTLGSIAQVLFQAFLTAFFFFFMSTSYARVLAFGEGLLPEGRRGQALVLLEKMDAVIAGFVRGRLTIATILVVFYTVAYAAIGVPAWLVLGLVVGALTLVPYAAGLVGIPAAILLLAIDPPMDFRSAWWWVVGAPLAVSMVQQLLDDYVLTPKIQGRNTGMDMPTVLFASIAGGILAGFYGLLLAIPAAACAKILIQEVFWPRFKAWSLGQATDFIPISKD